MTSNYKSVLQNLDYSIQYIYKLVGIMAGSPGDVSEEPVT